MTVDLDALSAAAEVVDADELDELKPARKATGAPAQYVDWFTNEVEGDMLFVPASALGQRSTRNGDSVDHDTKSLQTLSSNIRKYARNHGQLVQASARTRQGQDGILFERRQPEYAEGRGRPKGTASKAEAE